MKQAQKPTTKNTKNEILEAYESLLKEVEKNKSSKADQQKVQASNIVKQALSENSKDIIHQIAGLKLQVSQSLEDLGTELLSEREKLSNLQEAIKIQDKYLKDAHEITINTNSLEALLLAQCQKKEEFEEWVNSAKERFSNEISEKKQSWQKEQQQYESEQKEKREFEKKERKRQGEEYEYQLKITRQKEEDEYQQKKLLQERELEEKRKTLESECADRESSIITKEQELEDLRKYKEQAEKNLASAVEKTAKQIREELQERFKNEFLIKNKEFESEIALLKQNIQFLESKITDQEKSITSLNKQLSESNIQSQDLARKVIEGNANLHIQEIRRKSINSSSDKSDNSE